MSPPTAGNTWAPEAFRDAKRGSYVVYWASKLYAENDPSRGYVPFETTDLASGRWTLSSGAQLSASPRHGTVLPVTKAEHDRLTAPPAPVRADCDGLVAHWPLTATSGTVAADTTGHGYDGALAGDVTWAGGGLTFGGVNGHVQLPNNLLTGVTAATVSADVFVDPAQSTPYFLYGFGNPGGLSRGGWHNLAVTTGGGHSVLYLDGVEVARDDHVTTTPNDIGGGRTSANFLGRSVYAADRYLTGRMRDVRLYNRALSAGEIAALPFRSADLRRHVTPSWAV